MDKKEFNVFRCIFFSSFFAFGLFYELIACIFCGLYGGFWAYMSIERKRMAFYCNAESLIISILVVMYAITSFYGVDGGMGMIGFFKTANVFFLPMLRHAAFGEPAAAAAVASSEDWMYYGRHGGIGLYHPSPVWVLLYGWPSRRVFPIC